MTRSGASPWTYGVPTTRVPWTRLLCPAIVLLSLFSACRETQPSPQATSATSRSTLYAAPSGMTKLPSVQPKPAERASVEASAEVKRPRPAGDCDKICALSEPLGCPHAEECRSRCQSMTTSPFCSAEVAVLFKCLVQQPTKNWECDEDGIGAIRDPYCDKEQGKLATCIETRL